MKKYTQPSRNIYILLKKKNYIQLFIIKTMKKKNHPQNSRQIMLIMLQHLQVHATCKIKKLNLLNTTSKPLKQKDYYKIQEVCG